MRKLIKIQSPSPVMLAFAQNWRYDLEGMEECDRIIEKVVALMQNTSSSIDVERARSWLSIDWITREFVPAFLDLVPSLGEHAKALRKIGPVIDEDSYLLAQRKLKAAMYSAMDAEYAAMNAERSAMISKKSERSINWAARSAAWYAYVATAMDDSIDDVMLATGVTARSVALASAWSTARTSLSSTTTFLQDSALELLNRMRRIGNNIPASDQVFMNCSREEANGIGEDEKKAFLESLELYDFLTIDGREAKTTTKRTRL